MGSGTQRHLLVPVGFFSFLMIHLFYVHCTLLFYLNVRLVGMSNPLELELQTVVSYLPCGCWELNILVGLFAVKTSDHHYCVLSLILSAPVMHTKTVSFPCQQNWRSFAFP